VKMEQIGCSETSAHKIQTLGNHPNQKAQQLCVFFTHSFELQICGRCRHLAKRQFIYIPKELWGFVLKFAFFSPSTVIM